MSAKQTLDMIAQANGITRHAAQGSYQHGTQVVRYVYGGTTLRVKYGDLGGAYDSIVDVKVLEYGVNGDRTGWGVNGFWSPQWLWHAPTGYEGMSQYDSARIDGWYNAMHEARPFATLGWAVEHMMQLVNAKQRDEQRRRAS